MSSNDLMRFTVKLGKAQIDALFQRQDEHLIDDSEFVPILEVILSAFESEGAGQTAVDELWQYAYMAYDKACRQATTDFSFDENKKLMQSYLIGPRKRRTRKG